MGRNIRDLSVPNLVAAVAILAPGGATMGRPLGTRRFVARSRIGSDLHNSLLSTTLEELRGGVGLRPRDLIAIRVEQGGARTIDNSGIRRDGTDGARRQRSDRDGQDLVRGVQRDLGALV